MYRLRSPGRTLSVCRRLWPVRASGSPEKRQAWGMRERGRGGLGLRDRPDPRGPGCVRWQAHDCRGRGSTLVAVVYSPCGPFDRLREFGAPGAARWL